MDTQVAWDNFYAAMAVHGTPPSITIDADGYITFTPTLPEPVVAFLREAVLGTVAPNRISAVKWEAARRITAAGFTTTNQANWTRYASRLLRKQVNGVTLTDDEQLDADFAEAAACWIDAVRSASDAIEILAMSPWSDEAPWPPMPDPAGYRACPKVITS